MRHASGTVQTLNDLQEIKMETINYLEIKELFEAQFQDELQFEVLEHHYAPYSFGSGMTAYRIKGRIFKIIFDVKDNLLEFMVSASHEKYSSSNWITIFAGKPTDFLNNGITLLNESLESK